MLIKKSKREETKEKGVGGFRRGRGWVVSFPSTLSLLFVSFSSPSPDHQGGTTTKAELFFGGLIKKNRFEFLLGLQRRRSRDI